jgi:hypothetical protein
LRRGSASDRERRPSGRGRACGAPLHCAQAPDVVEIIRPIQTDEKGASIQRPPERCSRSERTRRHTRHGDDAGQSRPRGAGCATRQSRGLKARRDWRRKRPSRLRRGSRERRPKGRHLDRELGDVRTEQSSRPRRGRCDQRRRLRGPGPAPSRGRSRGLDIGGLVHSVDTRRPLGEASVVVHRIDRSV